MVILNKNYLVINFLGKNMVEKYNYCYNYVILNTCIVMMTLIFFIYILKLSKILFIYIHRDSKKEPCVLNIYIHIKRLHIVPK